LKRFILTGAPGSGKTAMIRQLDLDGFPVVEEAATDVIAAAQARGVLEPWLDPSFIGFITPTHARTISFEESLRFEKIHEEIYRSLGFELVQVQPAPLLDRIRIIQEAIR
jgi:predicted ATPase